MNNIVFCGIEVSAQELVVALPGKKGEALLQRYPNTAAGHRALLGALTRGGKRVRACMEATGMYGLDVALLLSGREGIELMVANPRAAKHFAMATMQRSKTDPLDALMLREFVTRMEFQSWVRPDERSLELWSIARRLQALRKQHVAEKNRQHAAGISQATAECVRKSVARMLCAFDREIKQLRKQARQCIASEERLQRRYGLLRSVPGIGETSAIEILAELVMLPEDRDVRQWVAYAGLDPREYSSGTSVRKHTRISKVGNRHLRCALYMPALVASRREPHLRGFYEELLARGKKKKQALMAVARKLLHAVFGMFRSGRPYDGARVYNIAAYLTSAPATGIA